MQKEDHNVFNSSIDVSKILGKQQSIYDYIDSMNKSQQKLLEALHIIESTLMFWDDTKSMEYNKKRMENLLKKYTT